MSNVQTVQGIYEAFGRGDIPALLGRMAPRVEWDHGISDTGVPWLEPRTGPAEVAKFFESLSQLDFREFQPRTFFENGNLVVVLLEVILVVKATGRQVVDKDEVHIWRFDDQGKVIAFRHQVDTHAHRVALLDQ